MSSSSASSKNLPAGGTSPIGRLSVELIHMIAWSLPRPDIDTMEVPMEAVEAWKAEQENHNTDLPPRPQELYPLARACKGLWYCLRPLLYHFDVILPTMVFKLVSDPNDWVLYDRSSKGSALLWGIENNEMKTVKFAVDTAPSVTGARARLPQHFSKSLQVLWSLWTLSCKRFSMETLPWSMLLTEDADASRLNQTLDSRNLTTSSWLARMVRLHNHASPTNMEMAALHVAIMLGHADIVGLLLTRYSQLDQSTLEWYEPTGLQMAAYVGDVKHGRSDPRWLISGEPLGRASEKPTSRPKGLQHTDEPTLEKAPAAHDHGLSGHERHSVAQERRRNLFVSSRPRRPAPPYKDLHTPHFRGT